MKITEYADILNLEIEVRYYSNQNNRWSAHFNGAEIAEGGCLVSVYGDGGSTLQVIEDYVSKIRGKTLVIHAMNRDLRREYVVPNSLEGL